MKSYKTAALRSKPYGEKTVRRMNRNSPKLIRGWRSDLKGGYREEGRG